MSEKSSPLKPLDTGLDFEEQNVEWGRVAALIATVAVIFFFTRSAPFPSATYWELALARDFDLQLGWTLLPENIALHIANSSASMIGLKAVYHIAFFILCCGLCHWVFKAREIFPGVMALAVFALSMQSYMSLRVTLQLLFIVGMITLLNDNRLKNNFGIILIPIIAAASALTLNSWFLVVIVLCHVVLNENYSPTLLVCAFIGLIFFHPEGAVLAIEPESVLSRDFTPQSQLQAMYLLAGVFLLINLANLARLSHEDLPDLVVYAISGFSSLIYPSIMTISTFIVVGMIIFFKGFLSTKPFPLNYHLIGIVALTGLIHLFLFVNPFGFNLNPTVKGQLGQELAPVLEGYTEQKNVTNSQVGELVWKGLITLTRARLDEFYNHKYWTLIRTQRGDFDIIPYGTTLTSDSFIMPEGIIPGNLLPELKEHELDEYHTF